MNDRVAPDRLRPSSAPTRWFTRFHEPRQAAFRLFCFPYAGGSASVYRQWAALADPRIDVVALQLPGRGPREVLDNPDLIEILMPTIRGDFRLLDDWRFTPSEPLAMPLYSLGGRSDPHVALQACEQWSAWTRSNFELLTYAGGHFFLRD